MIRYIAYSSIGLKRGNNEDNMYIPCRVLEIGEELEWTGESEVISNGSFAVFDGMGGELCGEIASFLAASVFGKCEEQQSFLDRLFPVKYIVDVCHKMNKKVCDCAKRKKICAMGTTFAGIKFLKGGRVIYANVGDSRIYRVRENVSDQLSVDHIDYHSSFLKAPVMQYLGIPENEMKIEPEVGMDRFKKKDIYLVCSDGVTDMVPEWKWNDIVSEESTLEKRAQHLVTEVKKAGAKDNFTFILLEVE